MNSSYVYSRTAASWRLAFLHAGKMLHFLTRALLLSLASMGLGWAWLCCWLEHFASSKATTAWIIPATGSASGRNRRPVVLADRNSLQHVTQHLSQHVSQHVSQPRTIDSLIRSKEAHV
jgi:hypothetical protein